MTGLSRTMYRTFWQKPSSPLSVACSNSATVVTTGFPGGVGGASASPQRYACTIGKRVDPSRRRSSSAAEAVETSSGVIAALGGTGTQGTVVDKASNTDNLPISSTAYRRSESPQCGVRERETAHRQFRVARLITARLGALCRAGDAISARLGVGA